MIWYYHGLYIQILWSHTEPELVLQITKETTMRRLSRSNGKVFNILKETLKRQIEMGELVQGEAIMAERRLASLFTISRESVRRGLKELIDEGYLKVVPAKGVFVDFRGTSKKSISGTSTLGYVFWGAADKVLHNPFFEGIIRGVDQEVRDNGFHLMVATHPGNDLNLLPPMVKDRKVDGILLEGAPLEAYLHIEKQVPVVVVANYTRSQGVQHERSGDMVSADNIRTVIDLVHLLYDLGHRRVGFVSPPLDHSSFDERYEGYQLGLHRLGLPFEEKQVIITQREPDEASIAPVLKSSDRPTGLICANDVTALSVYRAAKHVGLSIPEQLSVTGFDDVESAANSKPPLTTVRISTVEMGRIAIRRLLEKIEHREHDEILTLVRGEIIQRGSCAAPPKGVS